MSSNLITWGIAGLVLAVFFWRKNAAVQGCQDISSAELVQLLKQAPPPRLVDVRTQGEYKHGHIESASSRPLGNISSWSRDFKKEEPIVLICASGNRSKTAAKFLVKQGFKRLYNLKGGMSGWNGPVK